LKFAWQSGRKIPAAGRGYRYESETDYGDGYRSRLAIPVKFNGAAEPGFLDGRKIFFVTQKMSVNSYK